MKTPSLLFAKLEELKEAIDIFKPISNNEFVDRKKEYNALMPQKMYDKFNGGKPFKIGDVIKIDMEDFDSPDGGIPSYSKITDIYVDTDDILKLETKPLYSHRAYMHGRDQSFFVKSIERINNYNPYKPSEVTIMDEPTALAEIKKLKDWADANPLTEAKESIFKPATPDDSKERFSKYVKESKQKFEQNWGPLNVGDIIYFFDDNKTSNNYNIVTSVTSHSNSLGNRTINVTTNPIIPNKPDSTDYIVNVFEWPGLWTWAGLLFFVNEHQLKIFKSKEEAGITSITFVEIKESTDIFKATTPSETSERKEEYKEKLKAREIEAKKKFEDTFGTFKVGDTVEVQRYNGYGYSTGTYQVSHYDNDGIILAHPDYLKDNSTDRNRYLSTVVQQYINILHSDIINQTWSTMWNISNNTPKTTNEIKSIKKITTESENIFKPINPNEDEARKQEYTKIAKKKNEENKKAFEDSTGRTLEVGDIISVYASGINNFLIITNISNEMDPKRPFGEIIPIQTKPIIRNSEGNYHISWHYSNPSTFVGWSWIELRERYKAGSIGIIKKNNMQKYSINSLYESKSIFQPANAGERDKEYALKLEEENKICKELFIKEFGPLKIGDKFLYSTKVLNKSAITYTITGIGKQQHFSNPHTTSRVQTLIPDITEIITIRTEKIPGRQYMLENIEYTWKELYENFNMYIKENNPVIIIRESTDIFKPASKEDATKRQDEYFNKQMEDITSKYGKPLTVGSYIKRTLPSQFKNKTSIIYHKVTKLNKQAQIWESLIVLTVGPKYINDPKIVYIEYKHEPYFGHLAVLLQDKVALTEILSAEEAEKQMAEIKQKYPSSNKQSSVKESNQSIFKPASSKESIDRQKLYQAKFKEVVEKELGHPLKAGDYFKGWGNNFYQIIKVTDIYVDTVSINLDSTGGIQEDSTRSYDWASMAPNMDDGGFFGPPRIITYYKKEDVNKMIADIKERNSAWKRIDKLGADLNNRLWC